MEEEKTDIHDPIQEARDEKATELDLSENQLTELPTELGELTQLQELDLAGNQLTGMPSWLGKLRRLRRLDLRNNQFAEAPKELWKLKQLQKLNLTENELTELPAKLGRLRQLQQLHVGNNKLTELPAELGELRQLQELHLSGNQLTELPSELSNLKQLQTLVLSDNCLVELPTEFESLQSLDSLYLYGNEALNLPAELVGPVAADLSVEGGEAITVSFSTKVPAEPSEILDYYFRTRGEPRPLNEAKLILVGHGEVGKTSIVERLVHDRFNPNEAKTEGIQITKWPLTLPQGDDVRLHAWDFGGQEIMHATHQFFLTKRSLYVLVISGRGGNVDADAEYWLRLIESFGGDSPVIVVLNKINEHPFSLSERTLKKKYPIREFVRTDCKDRTGIDELQRAIERETDRLDALRDAFPASWFEIKDKLANMDDNYLDFRRYRTLCEDHGEGDAEAQEQLARHLHRLGVALNYKQHPRLQDTHVLNPRWVTNGIYCLLNSKKLEAQNGEVRLQDLADILDADAYPRDMRRFLIDLMKKFDLCFSFPEDEFRYLVPELLDKQEPEAVEAFESAACLSFQYHYPVLPEGLLPRFIVRTNQMSEGHPRWRTGVVLEFEGNRALVRADVQDKKVFIEVMGPVASRRRLLAVIRSEFERIHSDIRKLNPEAMVPVPKHPEVVVPYEKLCVMEENGVSTFQEVVDDEVIELNVCELLNGVDLEGARQREQKRKIGHEAPRLFISYAHEDENLRERLETHLNLMKRQDKIDVWHDREIVAGEELDHEISKHLERADVILLLVSADFLASDYCYKEEMGRALERHEDGEAKVIPVIVRDCNWHSAPFGKLNALPEDGKAVPLWKHRDTAWRNVAEGIKRAVEEMH